MRYKQGADQAFAPSYEADPTNMGGYNSYPDATDPEGGYSQPPFTGQPGQPPQSGTMPEAEPMSYQQQPWLSGWFWGLWEGYVYIYVYFSFFYLFFLFSLIYLPIYICISFSVTYLRVHSYQSWLVTTARGALVRWNMGNTLQVSWKYCLERGKVT